MRRSVFRGLVAAPIVVGGGFAALWWLPNLVREQVATRLEQRTGMSVRLEDVSLGLTSIAIGEIRLGEPRAKVDVEPQFVARHVVVSGNPVMLALRGQRAVESVRMASLSVVLPIDAPRTRDVLKRLFERSTDAHAQAARSLPGSPDLSVDRLDVVLRDADGELARLAHARVEGQAGALTLQFDRLDLGGDGDVQLVITGTSMGARRGQDGWQIARVRAEEARVWLGGRTADQETTSSTGAISPRHTWGRVRSAIDAIVGLRGSVVPGLTKAASLPRAATKAAPAWLAYVARDASFTLGAGTIYPRRGSDPIMQGMRATAKMQLDGAIALAGSGKAHGGGSLNYDLIVHPEQLQANGRIELRSLPLGLITPFLPALPWYEPEGGRVDAELVVKTDPATGIAFSGEAALHGAALSSQRLAAEPVRGVDFVLHGRGRFLPMLHRLEIEDAQLKLAAAELSLKGAIEWSEDHYLFDVDARLPPTPCTQAVRAIPESLLGDMALATWHGQLSGHLRLQADSRDLDKMVLDIEPDDRCDFVTVPAMADLQRFRGPFVHMVDEPDGTTFEMETGPGTSAWTTIEDISPFFVHAVLAHEDAAFFTHHGFSPRHIRDALARDLKEGRYAVGASTITMQLVKNVFLRREKTLARKIQEVLLTWWIERVMDKRDILELYLNVIEYGPGVYGIRNGARHYFNRMPAQLSPAESVYLATILPNPKRYHLQFERGSLSPAWAEIMRKLLIRLGERGSYSAEAVAYGQKELLSFRFVPEGTLVEPRHITAPAAPLPYERKFAPDGQWEEDGEIQIPGLDDADASPPPDSP